MSGANLTNFTLTIQRFVLLNRAARQEAAGTLAAWPPQVPLGG